ncbi:hypothetical protein SKAU_G00406740 [Synaphobranchus kaupii]|uniref:Uncharacterized protein n=1 Tax=Synaphobranchus kaupii TaxID=118154 RepID=A0A9Q1EA26_SYNKA|nr:hypothetical protein SKAU_G00406740 [Synaphobranchus kaupii]
MRSKNRISIPDRSRPGLPTTATGTAGQQGAGGSEELPADWVTTAEVVRETARKVLGVSSGQRKEDKETWWWNEEVQECIQRKRLAKKWDSQGDEESRQEYKLMRHKAKREVAKAKEKAYGQLLRMRGWTLRKEKRTCIDWLDRETELGRMCSRLTDKIRQESPWTMTFADDIVICSESREQVEENLERWRMLKMELPGKRRGRPKRRFMDVAREDMQVLGTTEEDAEERIRWKRMIRCGDP